MIIMVMEKKLMKAKLTELTDKYLNHNIGSYQDNDYDKGVDEGYYP